jgi:hypothetical protein
LAIKGLATCTLSIIFLAKNEHLENSLGRKSVSLDPFKVSLRRNVRFFTNYCPSSSFICGRNLKMEALLYIKSVTSLQESTARICNVVRF